MKPSKNRVFCNDCGKSKMLFDSKEKADHFLQYNKDIIYEENGKSPVRSYFCKMCGGWHLTSHSDSDKYVHTKGNMMYDSTAAMIEMSSLLRELELAKKDSTIEVICFKIDEICDSLHDCPHLNMIKYNSLVRKYNLLRANKYGNNMPIITLKAIKKEINAIENSLSRKNVHTSIQRIQNSIKHIKAFESMDDNATCYSLEIVNVRQRLNILITKAEDFVRLIESDRVTKEINLKINDIESLAAGDNFDESLKMIEKTNSSIHEYISKGIELDEEKLNDRLSAIKNRISTKLKEQAFCSIKERIEGCFLKINEYLNRYQVKHCIQLVEEISDLIGQAKESGLPTKDINKYKARALEAIEEINNLSKRLDEMFDE